MDANLLHISYEGLELENPDRAPNESMWRWTNSLQSAPDEVEYLTLHFEKGDCIAINNESLLPHKVLEKLNEVGAKHGVGRVDIVENRFVGIKSRGCYETPGGSILLKAHRGMESITLDREIMHLKDELMPKYARLIYNGFWFAPERKMLQKSIDASQENVTGEVDISLYKGNIVLLRRRSQNSLYNAKLSSFEEDDGSYNQQDAEGFIKLQALRLRKH